MRILTINAGSSSLKVAAYDMRDAERRTLAMEAERIGRQGSRMRISGDGARSIDEARTLEDHASAFRALVDWARQHHVDVAPDAIGHRLVHGGRAHRDPERLTAELLADLDALAPIDPDHLPQAISVIRAARAAFPDVPQVACFDTAFHQSMPAVAQRYPLPPEMSDAIDVLRYGFHGLSCEFILGALAAIDAGAARGRLVIAHLGNGASLTAVRNGMSVDTTMGFSPAGGIMMGTRSGDLDPGVLLYLQRSRGLGVDDVNRLVNHDAGLAGVSGTSGDMRDLLERESHDARAADAVALFCYLARKALGGLVAALGGLDTLVFTGGIGEHAAPVRARITADFTFLGLTLDPDLNTRDAPVISHPDSRVVVRVMPTNEDLVIARHTQQVLGGA
jgi:acetate kinase